MRKTLILSLAGATALIGTAVSAQVASERGQRAPEMSRAEMSRADVEQRATAMFARIDVNADGRIDAADRAARQDARFERLDADGNGAISKSEFDAVREARNDRRKERRAANGEGGEPMARGEGRRGQGMRGEGMRGEGMRGEGMRGRGGGMHMLRDADSNGDNAVSQAEFTAALLTRFDAADANNDGTVTREERRAQRQERRAGHRGQAS